MSDPLPFDRTDLARATRVVPAPVAVVYAAVTDVTSWPAWFPHLVEPVIAKGGDRFLFRARRDGRTEHHEGRVIVRGTPHAFGVEVGDYRVWFRTRPSPPGTQVDVVLEAPPAPAWRRFGRSRRRTAREQWVEVVLDGLAARLTPAG